MATYNPNYKVLATAQMTITDQTDASNLAGNMVVVTGSKSQVYLTGSTQPYSPDWKSKALVVRPCMIATNIYRGQVGSRYNPDLFDPWEYPVLTNPGDVNVTSAYIKDIKWYLLDSAGNETLIDPATDNRFSYTWEYTRGAMETLETKVITDARHLVIKDNILLKDQSASLLIKFAFHDPFADINIPVTYGVEINCLSTGIGHSKTNILSVNGTSFYNADPNRILFIGEYFSEGEKQNLETILADATSHTNVKWYIRSQDKGGWVLLDPATQDSNAWNVPGQDKAYEVHRVVSHNAGTGVYTTEKTYNARGGSALYVYKGLIAGSDIIKLTIQDSTLDGQTFNSLETLYDYSDPTRCYIHSTNGDKLFKGMQGIGTTVKAVVTHNGILLEDGATEYNTIFDYYWYKIEADGNTSYNLYTEIDPLTQLLTLKEKNTSDADYLEINGWPRKSERSLGIKPEHITNKATFTVDILNTQEMAMTLARTSLLNSLVTEDDILEASTLNQLNGLNPLDSEATMTTAYELKALEQSV